MGYRQPASFQLMRAKSRWHFVLYLPISELFKYSEFQMIYSTLFFLLHTHTQYHQSIHTTNMKVLIMNIKEKLHCKNKNYILDPFTESTHTHTVNIGEASLSQHTHSQHRSGVAHMTIYGSSPFVYLGMGSRLIFTSTNECCAVRKLSRPMIGVMRDDVGPPMTPL